MTDLAPRSRRGQPVQLTTLGPLQQLRAGRLARRLPQLFVGLVLYGASLALMVRGALGLSPWDVLHSGAIRHLPLTLGQAVVVFSFLVLLAWIPLREVPGLGTISNAIIVGLAADATLAVLVAPDGLWARVALLVSGVLLNALATALYIGSQFGRGPRDGLMTGLVRRTGWSLGVVRTGIELTVVAVGLALGGIAGLGTLVYAFGIGPLAQVLLPWFTVELDEGRLSDGSR
ncbi:membrane protein YczE [Nocardioides pacificus]